MASPTLYKNTLEQLYSLNPDEAVQVGSILQIFDDYRVRLLLPTNEVVIVEGQGYNNGDRVKVKGTRIVGTVPDLPSTTQYLEI